MSLASSSTVLPLVREPGSHNPSSLAKNEPELAGSLDLPASLWAGLKKKRSIASLVLIGGVVAVIVIVLAVVLPIYFEVIKHNSSLAPGAISNSSGGNSSDDNGGNTSSGKSVISGGDGSQVVMENGTTFTYHNPFGGYWVQDPQDPFNNDARPNSWTPPLNTSLTWGKDRIYGVNLGGWLVMEPFITPLLFQRYPSAKDEYDLSLAMASDTANGGLSQLENHYDTFISEQDIAEMAGEYHQTLTPPDGIDNWLGAGLNFIRVPIPFWAIETWEGEPFLTRVSWKYFLRFLGWARKYGMRVCIDLHTAPGSQNGYNHSGRLGFLNFLNGSMGIANAQRTMYHIRVLTEFISQPQYRNLIPIFGILNEPLVGVIGMDQITSFYLETHNMIRGITGYGEGNGPYIAIHDGFQTSEVWGNFLQGSDRIMMDHHYYFSFGGDQKDPLDVPGPNGLYGGSYLAQACNSWGTQATISRRTFGVTFVGEFAASPNDCGLFLRGAQGTPVTSNCTAYDNWEHYSTNMVQGIKNFVMASMDSFGDWMFWTWKIAAAQSGNIETPLWSYQLGYRNGWIPSDPRKAVGMCKSVGYTPSTTWDGTFKPWQTGTTSSIPASSSSQYPWLPKTISSAVVPVSLMPTYTSTASIITLPVPTFTSVPNSITQGFDGWFDNADTVPGVTAVAGCTYPDEYTASFAIIPTAPCTGPAPGAATLTARAAAAT